MSRFADYYIKYKHDFAPYDWDDRQSHLAALFAADDGIVFGEGEPSEEQQKQGVPYAKIFNHRVYHLFFSIISNAIISFLCSAFLGICLGTCFAYIIDFSEYNHRLCT
jgi:hypothetical protein